MLLLEFQEAKTEVKHLREKAIRIGREFQSFGRMIESQPETVIDISGQNSQGEVGLNHLHPRQLELLQVTTALSVANDIRVAQRAVRDLEQRMANLGISVG
jgi:hypothetical protein